jgi:hypothetical protein
MDEHISSVLLSNICLVARKSRHMVLLVMEAVEVELHPNNLN